jgi:two-component system chemotaxis response regulator CheB
MKSPKFVVVIGTSAGGLSALSELIPQLNSEMNAAFFIVMHLSKSAISDYLAHRLQPLTSLTCHVAKDAMQIERGHIYIAPPNEHLIVIKDQVVVGHGPAENLWRPSIDVLFRSAAAAYNSYCIGIILTGYLNDGTAGMTAIKRSGGVCIVQDPNEAEVADMPLNVLNNMEVDHAAGLGEIGDILGIVMAHERTPVDPPPEIVAEAEIASRMAVGIDRVTRLGQRSVYSCPDCGGGLWKLGGEGMTRYRCYTGHTYNESDLLSKQGDNIEETLWVAVRMMEERNNLYVKMASDNRKKGISRLATGYDHQASESKGHIDTLKKVLVEIQRNRSESSRAN